MWLVEPVQVARYISWAPLGGGCDELLRVGHPGEDEQAGTAGPDRSFDIGVQAVTHDEGRACTGPAYCLFVQRHGRLAGADRHLPRCRRDRGDQRSVAGEKTSWGR